MNDIDVIAFSRGPGLPSCLHVGASIARYLALKFKRPLVDVNHCVAHIEIGKLTTGAEDPIILYTSGGNTQILAFTEGRYRVFGETMDMAVGNAFDSLARYLGLEMPGRPKISKLAKRGKWIDMPYVVKGMDVSFSGLLTKAINMIKNGEKVEDVCYSFEEVCFSMLTEVTERALAHTGKQEVLLTGGVARAERLKEMLRIMCEEREAKFYVVEPEYSGDCGAMISWVGILAYKNRKIIPIKKSRILPHWRTDRTQVSWL